MIWLVKSVVKCSTTVSRNCSVHLASIEAKWLYSGKLGLDCSILCLIGERLVVWQDAGVSIVGRVTLSLGLRGVKEYGCGCATFTRALPSFRPLLFPVPVLCFLPNPCFRGMMKEESARKVQLLVAQKAHFLYPLLRKICSHNSTQSCWS
jgi:hypothetical protein